MHFLCHAYRSALQFGWAVSVLLSILPVGSVAFFLIFPFLPIPRREVVVVTLVIVPFVMLVIGMSFVPLVQLLLQLLIALGELLDCRGKGLHLPFRGVGGVFRSFG